MRRAPRRKRHEGRVARSPSAFRPRPRRAVLRLRSPAPPGGHRFWPPGGSPRLGDAGSSAPPSGRAGRRSSARRAGTDPADGVLGASARSIVIPGHRTRRAARRASPALERPVRYAASIVDRSFIYVSRVFITGGTGLIGTALLTHLLARGDEVVALARSDAAAAALEARGARVVRGDGTDEEVLTRGMEGCELAFNVAGVNSLCVVDPRPMELLNASGPAAAVRAAARAGVNRLVHTSSAATIGEPPGTIGREQTPHRGWYLSTYERTKTEGERAALAAARALGQDLVCVNPSSVQGPGRGGGTARFLLAFLDGRLKVFVPTTVSLIDIDDCVAGHLLGAERGVAGARYLLNGMRS